MNAHFSPRTSARVLVKHLLRTHRQVEVRVLDLLLGAWADRSLRSVTATS